MKVLLTQETPPVHQNQTITLSMARDLLTDLVRGHPQTHQGNQEQEDPLTFHLRDCLEGIQEGPLEDRHLLRHRHLLLPLRTLHRVLPGSLLYQLYQHRRTKRNPTSKRQRTSPKQRNGTASADKLSSTSRRTDEILTMTKRSFDSC
jgi:hypothetical protein